MGPSTMSRASSERSLFQRVVGRPLGSWVRAFPTSRTWVTWRRSAISSVDTSIATPISGTAAVSSWGAGGAWTPSNSLCSSRSVASLSSSSERAARSPDGPSSKSTVSGAGPGPSSSASPWPRFLASRRATTTMTRTTTMSIAAMPVGSVSRLGSSSSGGGGTYLSRTVNSIHAVVSNSPSDTLTVTVCSPTGRTSVTNDSSTSDVSVLITPDMLDTQVTVRTWPYTRSGSRASTEKVMFVPSSITV